jgi:hypothetical protein
MSRDKFLHDPRETSPPRSAPRHRSVPSSPRDGRNSGYETNLDDRARDHKVREGRDAQADVERAYYLRDRTYLLRDSELHSMKEIGKFRVIATADLATYAYSEDSKRMEKDLERLKGEFLVSEKTIEIAQKKTLRVVTLTKGGHRFLKGTNQVPDDQAIYHGLVKSREAQHDADLYRLYQKEASRIEGAGGRLDRVILDYEIKQNLNRDLARLGPEKDNPDRKAEVAQKHRLEMVNGKIPVPDMRLEYENAEHALERVDLELATREYRPRALTAKAKAGFSIYGRAEDASRLRRILDERELTREVLTL